jgi:putative cell wall-binding protein
VAQVVKQQDLKVTVTASPTSVTSGTNDNTNGVTYTIVTQNLDTNSTGVNATGVFWTFDVPNGVLVDDGTASYPGPSGRTWALDCDAGSSTLGDPGASWPSQAVCFLNGGIPAGGSVTSVVKANYSTSFKTPSNPSVATVNAYMDQVDSNPANNASSASVAVTNGNAAPTASVSTTVGGSAVDEHATTTRQYSWSAYDADGIGSVSTSCGDDGTKVADGTASGAGTSVGSPRTATFTCVFDDGPATATISATVTDGNGGTTTSTATVAVANVAPVAAIGAPATVTAGAGYTVSASATDVSTADTTAGYTYAFDCGTGTFGPFGTASTATCTGPAAGDSTTVQVKAMDKDGGTSAAASATVTADAAASSAPVALDRTASTTVDTPVEVTLQAGDVDDQPQTFSVVTGPSNGTVGLAAGPDCSSSGGTRTCTIVATYTPTGGYTGTDTFTYRANDGTADSAEATVTIHVGTGNTAPTAAPVTTSTPPNTTKVITLSGTDADGDALTFAGVDTTALHGTLGTIGTPDCPDGTPRTCTATVDYTPATNYTGTASFTYEVNDGTDDSSAATVSIDVENAAPTATARSYPVQKNVALDLTTLQGSDADGDATTLSIVADPTHGTLGMLTTGTCTGTAPKTCAGSVTYTPDGDYTGTDTFTYQANDGLTDSTAVTVTLLVGNDVPIAADETATTDYETAVPVTLDGADVNGDATTFDVQPPGHGTLTGTGDTPTCATASGTRTCHLTVTYTPDTAFRGTDTFTYTVSDGTGSSVQHTVTLTVNSPANTAPTATARTYPVAKNTATALTTLQGSDADGDATTLSIVADPTHGTLGTLTTGTCTGTAPKTCAGSVTYTPDGDYTGTDTFTYAANDGTDGSVPVTVTLLVGNTAPTGADQSLTTAEDTPKAVTLAGTDADGDTPAITISVPPAHGTLGLLGTPACTGTAPRSCTVAVTYTPASNASGTDTFKYLVDDGTATNEYTITLTVTPANDAPTAADFAATTTRGTPVQVQLVGTDVDGDTTTAAVVTGPSGAAGTLGSLGAVACAGTDTRVCTVLATFTPAAGYTGSTSFTYRVHDGTAASANATVTIDVLDRAPTATPQSISTGTGNARTITLAVTDPDADTTALTIVTGPTHGTLVTVGAVQCTTTSGVSTCTATVTYTPADGYTGGDSFTFRGDDGVLHDDAAVAVTVSPTAGNHKPTVSITITPDAPRTDDDVTAHIVTANDADADGLTFDYVWSVNGVVLQRTYGTTALTDVYHLAPTGAGDLDGLVTATVRAHDGKELGPSDEATVQVQNSAPSPTASAVSVGVSDGTTASQRTFDLTGSDPDDQVLEFRVTSLPTQGQLWFGTHQITAGDLPYVLPDFGSRLTYETLATAERTDTFAFAAGDTRLWSTTTANVTVGTFEYGSVGGPVTTLAAGAGRTTYSAIVPGAITAADPVKTSVSATAPTSAGISIDISDAAPPSFTPPSGYALLGIQQTIDILQGGTRVDMTLNQPFMVGFQLGASLVGPDVPLAQVKIFRDGVEVADCPAAYPCVQSRVRDTTTGTVTITILSDHASGWSFGVPSSDTTPPETTIFSGPSGATSAGSPNNTAGGTLTFAYVASEAGSTFECQLTRNGGATGHEAWTACNSGGGGGTFTTSIAVGGLPDDLYTFRVRATDSSANLDATPARRDVVVDRTAPTVTIRTGPPATTTATSATVTFTANEVGVTFRCAIDLQAWNACNAGTWTASGLATGIHTIVVEGSDPASNHSTDARSFTVTVAGGGGGTGGGGRGTTTGIQRWAGTSRGTTAVDVSKQLFPNGADTVYVARDDLFPDALTGGPQAAFDKAPILLTSPSKLSSDTLQEIKRLDPQRIVIVGGTSAVDGSVERALRGLAPEVGRLPGTDRYETATLVSRAHYPGRVDTVVLATGLAFPDALSGGAAAAKIDGPVLLTRSDELPASTLAELKRLRPKRIIVLGGTEAVSAEVLQQVDAATSGTIVRIAGANRYATSAALSQLVFSPPIGAAFVATGEDFPDALAAVPAAATYGSPLLLTQNDQLVTETDTELRRLAPSDLVILGGTAAVAKAVEPALVRAMGT